jgi:two-component system chemotaxis response regulator CheB
MNCASARQLATHPVRIVLGVESHSRLLALSAYLALDAELVVVDRCHSFSEVVTSVGRTAPDLVVIELDLLGPSATEAARRVAQASPVSVVVLANSAERCSERARAALGVGAAAVVSDSSIDFTAPGTAMARSFRCQFRRLAVSGRSRAYRNSVAAPRPAEVIGICASTGGPQALETVLSRIPADFPIPVLVTQHMMSGFTEGLVSWLDRRVPPTVAIACNGQDLESGVWFASDAAHLLLDASRHLAFDQGPSVSGHRPCGDVLLASLASAAGAGAVAVVLTGMGRDGAAGLAAVAAAGGRTIAQDEASSAVYGMPRAAAELGAEHVLSLSAIADELAGLAAEAGR